MASLFSAPNTFLDIKVLLNDTPFEQLHFRLQLLLAMNKLGCFEDKQNILGKIQNGGITDFLLKQAKNASKPNLKGGLEFESTTFSNLSDLWLYEQHLESQKLPKMQDLRYVLMKGLYPSTMTPNRAFTIPTVPLRQMILQL